MKHENIEHAARDLELHIVNVPNTHREYLERIAYPITELAYLMVYRREHEGFPFSSRELKVEKLSQSEKKAVFARIDAAFFLRWCVRHYCDTVGKADGYRMRDFPSEVLVLVGAELLKRAYLAWECEEHSDRGKYVHEGMKKYYPHL